MKALRSANEQQDLTIRQQASELEEAACKVAER